MKKMKKILVILPFVALVAAGCNSSTTPVNKDDSSATQNNSTSTDTSSTPTGTSNSTTNQSVTINVTAKNFSFDQKEIRVKKGDKVKIVLKNTQGFHDFVIDQFNVKTPTIGANQIAEVTFTADKTGTFEFYCSVGDHRQMGMKGNLIVE